MRYVFPVLFICLLFTYCKSQRIAKDRAFHLAMMREIVNNTKVKWDLNPNSRMAVYADSLNNLPEEAPLPSFLFNECFDLHKLLWPGLHTPISLRQIVVNKTTNKSVVERILKDNNPLLHKVCDYDEFEVPEMKKSFYELFRLRYAELK